MPDSRFSSQNSKQQRQCTVPSLVLAVKFQREETVHSSKFSTKNKNSKETSNAFLITRLSLITEGLKSVTTQSSAALHLDGTKAFLGQRLCLGSLLVS